MGTVDANDVAGIVKPRVLDIYEWSDQDWRDQRTEVMTILPGKPCSPIDALLREQDLQCEWWSALRRSLDTLATTPTQRVNADADPAPVARRASVAARWAAASPSAASPTTSMLAAEPNTTRKPARTTAWSSATSIRIVMFGFREARMQFLACARHQAITHPNPRSDLARVGVRDYSRMRTGVRLLPGARAGHPQPAARAAPRRAGPGAQGDPGAGHLLRLGGGLQPAAPRARDRKAAGVLATGATVLVTANPGCLMQIASAAQRQGADIALAHTVAVLDASIRGVPLCS